MIFAGFVSGRDKFEKLATLTALFVPSITENFGMTIAEALLMKVPVMASLGTPWKELNTYHCGWWVSNEVPSLAKTLLQAISLTDKEREDMGIRGRLLVESNYSSEQVARKMKLLYEWLLGIKDKPDFIYE